MCVCLSLSLSLFFSLFFSAFWYIINNLYVHEQSRSAHSMCNCAIDFVLFCCCCVYTYVSWVLSVSLCLNVCSYIITHCRCKCAFLDPCFSISFSLNVFIRARLYWDWLYVYRYVSWSSLVSLCLCQRTFLSVRLSVRVCYRKYACMWANALSSLSV